MNRFTKKQKQACKRNFALMRLVGTITNLQNIAKQTSNDLVSKKATEAEEAIKNVIESIYCTRTNEW